MGRKRALGFLGGAVIGSATGGPVGTLVGGLIGALAGDAAERRDEAFERRLQTKHYECSECNYEWTSKKSFGRPAYCPSCRSKRIRLTD